MSFWLKRKYELKIEVNAFWSVKVFRGSCSVSWFMFANENVAIFSWAIWANWRVRSLQGNGRILVQLM